MSFDQDPNESVTISGSDFAEMCDEIKKLTENQNYLIRTLNTVATVFAVYEKYHADKGAMDKATPNGWYKQMCLDAINKASGNV